MNLDKLASDVAMAVHNKLNNEEDKKDVRPGLMSPQFMAETGMDALEIALRKFIAGWR